MASGEIIVMMDGDGSHDPVEIPRFVETLMAGHDFAKGSRFAAADGASITLVRRSGIRVLTALVNLLFETRYSDLGHGYNAFRRDCLAQLQIDDDRFEVETLIHVRVARAGLAVAEVASVEHERMHGESKLSAVRDGQRILRMILRERVRREPAARHPDGWRPTFRELPPVAVGHGRSLAASATLFMGSAAERVAHISPAPGPSATATARCEQFVPTALG